MAKPNILIVMADQVAAPALPMYGHPVTQTPHLSALARSGVVFEAAYCNSPLCAPSRAALMTGRLPSQIGVYDNAAAFSPELPTFAHYLRRLGYRTALSGKMHLIGPDQLRHHPRVLVTPHSAWCSEEAEQELGDRASADVARVLRDEPPLWPANQALTCG